MPQDRFSFRKGCLTEEKIISEQNDPEPLTSLPPSLVFNEYFLAFFTCSIHRTWRPGGRSGASWVAVADDLFGFFFFLASQVEVFLEWKEDVGWRISAFLNLPILCCHSS